MALPSLDSLHFDTFGWEQDRDEDGVREWRSGNFVLSECFFKARPAPTSPEKVRQNLVALESLMGSEDFSTQDLELSEPLAKLHPAVLEHIKLLELEFFEIPPAKCVLTMMRGQAQGHNLYSTNIQVLFAERFWGIELAMKHDADSVEAGEDAIGSAKSNDSPKLDSGVDLSEGPCGETSEQDPVTHMRLLAQRLRDSITFEPEVLSLKPFVYNDE